MKKNGKLIDCANCGNKVHKAKWQLRHGEKYCSRACHNKDRSKIMKAIWASGRMNNRKKVIPHNKGIKGWKHSGSFKKGNSFNRGKNHWNWKGKVRHSLGYIKINMPEHPYADSQGYIMEHRLVMEKHISRYLIPKEVIHHIDFNKTNNNINNLYLFPSNSAHRKYHEQLKNEAVRLFKETIKSLPFEKIELFKEK